MDHHRVPVPVHVCCHLCQLGIRQRHRRRDAEVRRVRRGGHAGLVSFCPRVRPGTADLGAVIRDVRAQVRLCGFIHGVYGV